MVYLHCLIFSGYVACTGDLIISISYAVLQLSLNDNELTGNLESVLDLCPEVSHVGLAGNRIADLAELKPLVSRS